MPLDKKSRCADSGAQERSQTYPSEGDDDQHTMLALLEKHQVPKAFDVKSMGGIDSLLESFELMLDLSERIAIIIDADTDATQRWSQVVRILTRAGFAGLPEEPVSAGTVLHQPGRPVVGIWIMPDNKLPGILEDFVEFLVPDGDPLWPWAKGAVNSAPECEQRFGSKDIAKATVHAWLAVQRDPGTPIGFAITKRYLDADAAQARLLVDWVRRVFV